MDKLKELIKKYGNNSCEMYKLYTYKPESVDNDIMWLITEIEQLQKVIETLIKDASEQGIDLSVPNGKEHITNPD